MRINKKKGIALMSALILMSVIISFTGLFLALVQSFNLANKIEQKRIQNLTTYYNIRKDFLENQVIDNEYDFAVEVIEHDANTKAVVVKRKNNSNIEGIIYYFIYDFSNSKLLAEQNKNFYITIKNDGGTDYYYLADLVKYMEV